MSESAAPAGTGDQITALAGPLVPSAVELLLAKRAPIDTDQLRRALGDGQLKPHTSKALLLSMQRQLIAVLVHQQLGDEARTESAAAHDLLA